MHIDTIKELFDACFLARKITQMLPPLPDGVVMRHAQIIDAIVELADKSESVHVGDVSRLMECTTPSITKLLGELTELGYVSKKGVPGDRRRVAIGLTRKGRTFHEHYTVSYHKLMAAALSDLSEGECRTAIKIINTLYERIEGVSEAFDARAS